MKASHHKSLGIGILLVLPFILLNYAVASQFQPLISFLRPDSHTSLLEQILLSGALVLACVGGAVALRPIISRDNDDKTFYIINAVFGVFIILASLTLLTTFAQEVYYCDVMKILICD